MNKVILTGVLLISSLPFLASATESSAEMSQSTKDYIAKLNCDSFTGNAKTYCLDKKQQASQNQNNGKNGGQLTNPPPQDQNAGSSTDKPRGDQNESNHTPPPRDGSGEMNKKPPHQEGGSGAMSGQPPKKDNMNMGKVNCDTFTGEAKTYCLEKKKQAQLNPNTGSGTNMPPKGKMMPPPKQGTGAMLPPKQGSGMANTPQNDGISAGVAKLSETDRLELMKMIQSFLESKGIKANLPPEMKAQANDGSDQNTGKNPEKSSDDIRAKMDAKREMLKPKKPITNTSTNTGTNTQQ